MKLNVNIDTEKLLDQIDLDDIALYLYNKKLLSHQQVKKICGKDNISECGSISYFTDINFEDVDIDEEDILDNIWDDDIYRYLENNGYDFPKPEPEEVPDPEPTWDNIKFIKEIKSVFNRRFGRTYTKSELKNQINDCIDWFSFDND